MKTTVVPAQVTTVEDKIAGNLSFTQLLLLVTPVFLGGAVFVLFPPLFRFSYLKLLICAILAILCMTLAIRIKGKILLQWLLVISQYLVRPRLYLFNKNDLYLRQTKHVIEPELLPASSIRQTKTVSALELLSMSQLALAEAAIADPDRKFHLKTVKGGLRVIISEIPEESI